MEMLNIGKERMLRKTVYGKYKKTSFAPNQTDFLAHYDPF